MSSRLNFVNDYDAALHNILPPTRGHSRHDVYDDDVSHVSASPPPTETDAPDSFSPDLFAHEDLPSTSPFSELGPPACSHADTLARCMLPSFEALERCFPDEDYVIPAPIPPIAALLSASASAAAQAPPPAAPRGSYCKHWCFTLPHPTPDECAHLACLYIESEAGDVEFLAYGHEVGEGGTPHLQGYLELYQRKRLPWLKDHISARAHFEPRRGTREQARDYCFKDGEWLEFGQWHEEERGRRRDIEIMVLQATEGTPFYEAAQVEPSTAQFPYAYTKLLEGQAMAATLPYRPVRVIVKVGPTGCGKTRSAYDNWPDLFVQDCSAGGEIWWDGYSGQSRLILDDFEGCIPYPYLLRLLDVYPIRIKVKGAHTYGRWSEVIITSNRAVLAWYPKRRDVSALVRRIDQVHRYVGRDQFVVEHFDDSD